MMAGLNTVMALYAALPAHDVGVGHISAYEGVRKYRTSLTPANLAARSSTVWQGSGWREAESLAQMKEGSGGETS